MYTTPPLLLPPQLLTYCYWICVIPHVTVLAIFVLEIVLKLTEHFWAFWASNWNLADFIVTAICVVLEIMRYSNSVSIIIHSYHRG